MSRSLQIAFALSSFALAGHAHASSFAADLKPESIVFWDTRVNDLTNELITSVQITVRNVGNNDLARATSPILFNGLRLSAYIAAGPGNLVGATIHPGATAKMFVSLPLGSLQHCQKIRVNIDPDHTLQTAVQGRNVYANDEVVLFATQANNRFICAVVVGPFN